MNVEENIVFRDINEKDVEPLYTMLNELTLESKRFFHPHPFDKKTITEICTSGLDHYFVMEYDGLIIGYSMLRKFGYAIPSFGCCVRDGYYERGYGTMLTVLTLQKAKALGYNRVILRVDKNNRYAIAVYRKAGFWVEACSCDGSEIRMEVTL